MNKDYLQYQIIKIILKHIFKITESKEKGYDYFCSTLCMSKSSMSKYRYSKSIIKFRNYEKLLLNIDKQINKGEDVIFYLEILEDINEFLLKEKIIKKNQKIQKYIQLKEIKIINEDHFFSILMLYIEKSLKKYEPTYTILYNQNPYYIHIQHSSKKQNNSFLIILYETIDDYQDNKNQFTQILILNFSKRKKINLNFNNKQITKIENMNYLLDLLENNSFKEVAIECNKIIDKYMIGFNQYILNNMIIKESDLNNELSLAKKMNYLAYHEYTYEKNLVNNLSRSSQIALFINSLQILNLIEFHNQFKTIILAISQPILENITKKYIKNQHLNNIKIIQFNGTVNSLIHHMYLLNKGEKIDLLYIGQGSASLLDLSFDSCTKIAGLLSDKGKIILSFINSDSQILKRYFYNKQYMTFDYELYDSKIIYPLIYSNITKAQKNLSNYFTIKKKHAYPLLGTLYDRNDVDADLRRKLRTVDKLIANISINNKNSIQSDSKENSLIKKLIELNNELSAYIILYGKKTWIDYDIDEHTVLKAIKHYRIIHHEPYYSSYKLYKYLESNEGKKINLIKVIIFKTNQKFVYYLTTNIHNLSEKEIENIKQKHHFNDLSIAPRKEVSQIHYNHPITPLNALLNTDDNIYIYNIDELKNITEQEIYCSFNELKTICVNKEEFIEELQKSMFFKEEVYKE